MRYFNTAGPCLPDRHYLVPPEPRLPDARGLIDRGHYFVVHAPRQTGKTTTLRQLDGYLNQLGLDHGTLVIFDRRDPAVSPADLTRFSEERTASGRPVTLLRA